MSVLGMNEGTAKFINFDLVGTVNTQVVGIGYGTINTIGTLPTLTIGTINLGTTVGNVASGVADSGNPVKVGGIYNSTAITLTNGQRGDLQLDSKGNLYVALGALISGEDLTNNVLRVEEHFSSILISSATTTIIKSAAGFLHTITITGGTAGTIIIYDNTGGSGTQIINFDSTAEMKTYIFDIVFSTGLVIVTSAATKMTVSYR